MRMYHDNKMLYKFNVEKPVHAIRFGLYGREDNTLVIVHGRGGAITIKIMRRSVCMIVCLIVIYFKVFNLLLRCRRTWTVPADSICLLGHLQSKIFLFRYQSMLVWCVFFNV